MLRGGKKYKTVGMLQELIWDQMWFRSGLIGTEINKRGFRNSEESLHMQVMEIDYTFCFYRNKLSECHSFYTYHTVWPVSYTDGPGARHHTTAGSIVMIALS